LRFLLVKTSSMGDVIHNLPVATDLARAHPGCRIDWVVEEGFAAIPRLHPAVCRVIPVALRRWRRRPLAPTTWSELSRLWACLAEEPYDKIIDTQGLVKSALIARMARGRRCGFDRGSAREPLAAALYDERYPVERDLHAVERNRRLAAHCAGYVLAGSADYGIQAPARTLSWLPASRYVVLLHATSRDDKLWPEARWVELGRRLADREARSVIPWGGPLERQRAERLAAAIPSAVASPRIDLEDLAAVLAGAWGVVGVDTGLTHLAAALGRPVVGIYCATDPGLTGVYAGSHVVNVGGAWRPPPVAEVLDALWAVLH
jgi:heptosyltransferase-1